MEESPIGVRSSRSARGIATRQALTFAAIEILKEQGFAGASARVVAERAGVNQGLVFYHFGSVTGLLLSALDWVSEQRTARYSEVVAGLTDPGELVPAALDVFREDLEAGHVAVLVAMMSGTSSTPGLGEQIASRIAPWIGFVRDALATPLEASGVAALIPLDELAYAIVALYLGLELLTELDGNRAPAEALFSRAAEVLGLLAALSGPSTPSRS